MSKNSVQATEKITFDYYYERESEQFLFYRIPKDLFLEPIFKKLSTDAKVVYGFMLDRMGLSAKNNWYDKQGRVYIYFTIEAITELCGFSSGKIVKIFKELDDVDGIGLIERKKQGLGLVNLLYK